ncbi:MAG: hypothetical protein U0U66_14920 [Cytophagaceae bacterium]
MSNFIVFQVYGKDYIFNECFYAILSILNKKPSQPFTFLIYTDQPQKFDWLQLPNCTLETLSNDTIQLYKGEIDFVHRVKIKVLEHALSNYKGNFIYLDTDMYALTDITELFKQINTTQTLMHEQEGSIKSKYNLVAKKIYKFVNTHLDWLKSKNITLDLYTIMYNAGVIGISNEHKSVVAKVLSDTDIIYPIFPSHIVEQISFSLELKNHSKVIDTSDVLFHYWFFKEYRAILAEFFDYHFQKGSSIKNVMDKMVQIDPIKLSSPKLNYIQAGFFNKIYKRVFEKKWTTPKYQLD